MNKFVRIGRALLIATAVLAVGTIWLAGCGCGDKREQMKKKGEQMKKEAERMRKGAEQGFEKISDYFTDLRDGQKYRTVNIGGKTWMAQNLNYQTGKSWCYGGDNSNCEIYGRLYDWNTAKSVCSGEWRLPSRKDWRDLEAAAGGAEAGKALKSTYGWIDSRNGTDNFGFSALPAGVYFTDDGDYLGLGGISNWWGADAYSLSVGLSDDKVHTCEDGGYCRAKSNEASSVRCVKDQPASASTNPLLEPIAEAPAPSDDLEPKKMSEPSNKPSAKKAETSNGDGGGGRKGVAGIGYGSGYGSGFDGGADDLMGGLMGGGNSGLELKKKGELKVSSPDFLKGGALTGGRSRASIQRVVMQNMAALRYAYSKRLREKPGLTGKIIVKFAIDEFGKVTFANLVESTMGDSELETTVVSRVKSWNFEKIDKPGDITEVVYPFTFTQ